MRNILITALLISGCTVNADITEQSRNRLATCTDFRDGEVFIFNTNTVTNVRYGFGVEHTMDIVTTDGKKRSLSIGMTAYLKCVYEPLDDITKE